MKAIDAIIDIDYVRKEIVKRPCDMHKGDAGKILVVAGSKGMAGAAALCAKAALRTGSGLVQIAVTEDILDIVQCIVPEATCLCRRNIKNMKEQDDEKNISNINLIQGFDGKRIELNEYDAIAFGPGLGVNEEGKELLLDILSDYEGTLVIDADGLNIIAEYALTDKIKEAKASVIITPHAGEAKRLLGRKDTPMGEETREEMAIALAVKFNCIALLKGNMTIIAYDEKINKFRSEDAIKDDELTIEEADMHIRINATGNPGMATAGSGDVLTGIIASLAGQGILPVDAAQIGAFVHGMAADIMAVKLGEYGLISSDIVTGIAFAMKSIQDSCEKKQKKL